jgi:hypothetical protein
MIIARNDSNIRTLADLAGKRFAFGDPNSTMSHFVPRTVLAGAGLSVSTRECILSDGGAGRSHRQGPGGTPRRFASSRQNPSLTLRNEGNFGMPDS